MTPIAALVVSAGLVLGSWLDLVAPFVSDASRWSRKGEASYREEDWAAAEEHFDRAAEALPGGTREYNRGAAAYKNGRFDEALAAFGQADGSGEVDPGRLAYDRGNARLRAGDLAGALEDYRAALRAHPDDDDARANFELAYRLLQEAPKQPQGGGTDPKDPESGESGEKAEGQPSPQDSQDGNPGGDEESRDQAASETPADSSAQEPESRDTAADGEPMEPAKMTPEEAQRLLNAVTPEERELLQARLKAARKKRAEKDW